MNIGDQPAFPVYDNDNQLWKEGMTYRQWLVGMIAPSMNDEFWSQSHDDEIAKMIIHRADAIIERMEKEGK